MNRRLIYRWIAVACVVLLIGISSYGRVVHAFFAEDIPATWNRDLLQLNHGELVQQLGPPHSGMPVKGYQYWEKQYWWGRQLLQIGYLDCCTAQSKPEDIFIAVYAKGKYDPIAEKAIPAKMHLASSCCAVRIS